MTEYLRKNELFLKWNNPKTFYFCSQNLVPFREVTEFLNSNNTNELLIYGRSGVGKTHLIGCAIQNTFVNSLYIDSSDFISTFYKHLKLQTPLQAIFDRLLSYELLIFDSFQLVIDRPIIKEVFSTLLKQFTKQKVIFIWTTEDEMIDLNGAGISLNVSKHLKLSEPPKNCLKTVSEHFFMNHNKNIKLTDNAFELIFETIHPDFRSLMEVLTKLLFFYGHIDVPTLLGTVEIQKTFQKIDTLEGGKIDLERAKEHLLNKICQRLKFDPQEIKAETRKKEIVNKRDIVIYLLKKQSNLTHEEIGRLLNKDHSTVTYAIKKIEEKLKNQYFREYIKNYF